MQQFKVLPIDLMRTCRTEMARRDGHSGQPLSAETLQDSHASMRVFLRWADAEGYKVDPGLLKLLRVKVSAKEPTVYHLTSATDPRRLQWGVPIAGPGGPRPCRRR